jgi:hypothetical protein
LNLSASMSAHVEDELGEVVEASFKRLGGRVRVGPRVSTDTGASSRQPVSKTRSEPARRFPRGASCSDSARPPMNPASGSPSSTAPHPRRSRFCSPKSTARPSERWAQRRQRDRRAVSSHGRSGRAPASASPPARGPQAEQSARPLAFVLSSASLGLALDTGVLWMPDAPRGWICPSCQTA